MSERQPCPDCPRLRACDPHYCALRGWTNYLPGGQPVRRHVSREELAGELDGLGISHNLNDPKEKP